MTNGQFDGARPAQADPRRSPPARFPAELLPIEADSDVGRLMIETDWEKTALGPVTQWPAELRTAVGICANSPFPMLIMWGPDLAMIYNDAFVPILGAKHPALGEPCAEVWSDAWTVVGDMIIDVLEHGRSTHHQNLPMTIHRYGFDETVYFTFAYSAIPVASGVAGGVFTVVTETTDQVLNARRMATLQTLGESRSAEIVAVDEACRTAASVLADCPEDLAFGAIYLMDDSGVEAALVASFGAAAPVRLRLPPTVSASTGYDWIWQALLTGTGRTLTGQRLSGFEHDDHEARAGAVALPLGSAVGKHAYGVLVCGVVDDLVFDAAYRSFLNLVADHVSTAIGDAEVQAARLRRTEELAALDRAKTDFFTGISHELRTPLTLIAGPLDDSVADERQPLAPDQRTRIDMARRNVGRLRRMVDTLLDFSRIESRQGLRFEPVGVDLGALTRGIAESFAPAVSRAGVDFVVKSVPGSPTVLVDPVHWERIVLNLLSNAVKFTVDGEIEIGVRVGATVELTVRDTGIGIPADELPHIFERFRQVRNSGGRSHEGSGIGLALVSELAALHGGTATVTSELGRGSVFTVEFPAHLTPERAFDTPPSSAVQDYLAEALQWSAAEGPAPALAAEGGSVLIAEDNADLRAYLSGLLAPRYSVTLATDGLEALAAARDIGPDLVLTDIMMPRMDGLALLRELRADPSTARIPVIFLSARAGEDSAAAGLAAGADDYLTKPFTSTDLLARVRSNLNLARLRNHESIWRTTLVNAMRDGFFVAGPDLTVFEINAGFTELLGYESSNLPSATPHPWWPTAENDPAGLAMVRAAVTRVRAEGRGRFVVPLRHRDGHRLWVDAVVDSLRDESGHDTLFVGTLRDVTAQQLATERDAAVARLTAAFAGVDDSRQVIAVGLRELRRCWQAGRASLLAMRDGSADPFTVMATTDPDALGTVASPGQSATEILRAGSLFTVPMSATMKPGEPIMSIAAPLYDGAEHAAVWLEFDRPYPFSVDDRALLLQLTGHFQRALARARALEEQRQIALALQRAILGPLDLPVGFAVRYEPSTATLEVGGDWYDVVELPHSRFGLVVGDVVGHGLAAATAMGQLRSAARALLLEGNAPARVLSALDRFAATVTGAYCATVFCAVIDAVTGEVRYASAGHLPALLAAADGTVHRLDQAQSPPLAVRAKLIRREAITALAARSTLLLYTDGLVERRREPVDTGIDEAGRALAESAELNPEAAVDHICARLNSVGPGEDDIALLLYRAH
ncbi:SpoIIE family protein phosphatase [Nocardia sp. NPDC058058]|uniref:SpoIIE family protein phosphatase n=1 Tax=Nocardia sp. NPDC058058 TaxID=3346317 RepID=UPI0036DF6D83